MKSLVTGGAGFIGSHVAQHCLRMGQQVVVLDDLTGGFRDQVPEGAKLVVGSITDAPLISELFSEHRFDYVYHLAAYAAEGLSHFVRRFNYTNNVIGTVNLINEAIKREVKCFVFASSIAVYGRAQLPMREDMVPEPEDPYGIAKYAVELDLRSAYHMFGLNFVIFRPHNVYGEHQNLTDKYRNVIGIFMNQIMRGEPVTVFGDGEQTRAFSYIDDVAPHIARSVDIPEAHGEIINIGADTPYTVNRLAQVVASAFGVMPDVRYLPPRKEIPHVYSDHAKARQLFGAGASISLEQGIRRMSAWAKSIGVRGAQRYPELELRRGLPALWA